MSSTAAPDPKVGLLLNGRYLIVRKLGEGGMGAVYEAKHQLTGRKLAIKCLHQQFLSNREVVERFHREAQAATAVGNEHIIEVTDMGTFDDNSPFIVLEFLDGVEFAKLLEKESALPISRVVHIVSQVCDALRNAHAQSIVHRDLKPENIYLIKRGQDSDFVKVLDFGISKMKENAEEIGSGLTKTGMALGTPYYMSPEQAQGMRDVDHRTDIYAIGVILFQALTGRLPFDADSYPQLMVRILTQPVASLRTYREDIPPALDQVVLRAMAKDRAQRFATVEELASALRAFATMNQAAVLVSDPVAPANQGTTPLAWAQTAPSQPTLDTIVLPKSKMPLYASIGVATLAVIGIVVFASGSKDDLAPPVIPVAAMPAPVNTAQPPDATPDPTIAPAVTATPKPTEVTLKVSATPADARIFIGEVEFPNPMDAFRPRSLDPVRITVKKDGYRTIEQLAIFDQDRTISFDMERGSGIKRMKALGGPAAPTATNPTTAATETAPSPVAAPAPTPTTPAAPAPPPVPTVTATPPADDGVYRGASKRIKDF